MTTRRTLTRSQREMRRGRRRPVISGPLALIVGATTVLTVGSAVPVLKSSSLRPNLGKSVATSHWNAPVVPEPASSTSVTPLTRRLMPGQPVSLTLHNAVTGSQVETASLTGWASTKDGVGVSPAALSLPDETAVRAVSLAVVGNGNTDSDTSGLAFAVQRTDGDEHAGQVMLSVPASAVESEYGADFSSRVHWVQQAADGKQTPLQTKLVTGGVQQASFGTSSDQRRIVITAAALPTRTTIVAMGAPTSTTGTGSFAATALKPSNSWDVSAQTGAFSWSYPLSAPPAAAGPAPSLGLSYDSQSLDGETASSNNQSSPIGDGWSLSGAGFIERTYVSCSTDDGSSGPVTTSGDECWRSDNATINLAGHSGTLIKDATSGAWHLQTDDGSKFEHLVGQAAGCGASNGTYDDDCWRLTTQDGTRYYFGLNQLPGYTSGNTTTNSAWTVPVYGNDSAEPCHQSTFAASACTQAWRWNLDYVVDPSGNAEAMYYNTETNNYAQNGGGAVSYVRGGSLNHIDYGIAANAPYAANAASDRMTMTYAATGRCSDAGGGTCTNEPVQGNAAAPSNGGSYPDTPYDQLCTTGSCSGLVSPSFWTTTMLSQVTSQVFTAATSTYANVEQWALGHSFPAPGDGTNAALWMTKISHTGYAGSTSLATPDVTFTGTAMQNRVWVTDGLAPLDKYRISSITSDIGAVTTVNYTNSIPNGGACTAANASTIEANAQTNTLLCYPQTWNPQVTPPQASKQDLFFKYVVSNVVVDPRTGGTSDTAQTTNYAYTGTPAWRYDLSPFTPTKYKTWNGYAGFDRVEVRSGPSTNTALQPTTAYLFFRGMDGDKSNTTGGLRSVSVTGSDNVGVTDSLWLAGRVREKQQLNGVGGTLLTKTITTPWAVQTSSDGTLTARFVADGTVTTTSPLSTGGSRVTTTNTTYDATYGLPTKVSSITDAGSTCSVTSYAMNTSAWLINYPSEQDVFGKDCTQTPTYPTDALGSTRYSYDNAAQGTAPTRGLVTKTEKVSGYSGTTPTWITASAAAYDSLGRSTTATDTLSRQSSTAYTPTSRGPVTAVTTTNPMNWTSTTAIDPAWGNETSVTDVNGHVTTASYDALGRRTAVWQADRPQAQNPNNPTVKYAYIISQTAPLATITSTLNYDGSYQTAYALLDGMGRARQTQAPSEGGGTIVTDTYYDAFGRAYETTAPYWTNSSSPSATLVVPQNTSQIPGAEQTLFDGANRKTASVQLVLGNEQWRTSLAYLGADRLDTVPPAGGTATSSYTDSRGRQVQLAQYHGDAISGTPDVTTYGYDLRDNRTAMTDPAGNKWAWTFDLLNRNTVSSDPDKGTSTIAYDNAGRVLTQADSRGAAGTLAFTYDNLDRKTGEYLGTTSGTKLATWTYDTLSKGNLTSSSRFVSGAEYKTATVSVDALDRPTATSISIPTISGASSDRNAVANTYVTNLSYNTDGSLSEVDDPAAGNLPAESLYYDYTALGHLLDYFGNDNYLSTATYDHLGNLVGTQQAEGSQSVSAAFTFAQGTNRLTRAQAQTNAGSNNVIQDSQFTYDNAGDVTAVSTVSASGGTDSQCFTYDYLQRLQQAWTPTSNPCSTAPAAGSLGGPAAYWQTYNYDLTGNRTQIVRHGTTASATTATDTYAYPTPNTGAPHSVTSVARTLSSGGTSTATYGYDTTGNTTTRGGQTWSYDAEQHLANVTAAGQTQTDIYDASGNRLLQTDPTGTTVYLGDTEVHANASSNATSGTRTYTGPTGSLAVRTNAAGSTSSSFVWLVTDKAGTASAYVNSSNGTFNVRRYDPFGAPRDTTAVSWPDNHGFLDKSADGLTQTTHLGAREYDSTLGRFTAVDPVLDAQDPQQNNGYSYSHNNPVTYSDPTGLHFDEGDQSANQYKAQATENADKALMRTARYRDYADDYNSYTQYIAPTPPKKKHSGGLLGAVTSTFNAAVDVQSAITSAAVNVTKGVAKGAISVVADGVSGVCGLTGVVSSGFASGCSSIAEAPTGWIQCNGSSICNVSDDVTQVVGNVALAVAAPEAELAEGAVVAGDGLKIAEGTETVLNDGSKLAKVSEDAAESCEVNSFTGETPVTMADGTQKLIKDVAVGDHVLASDPETGQSGSEPVIQLIRHTGDHLMVDIGLSDGTTLHSTDQHPIWDATTRAFTYAIQLHAGDQVLTVGGGLITISGLKIYTADITAYNLQIDTIHTYFAGSTPVLVHNSCRSARLDRIASHLSARDLDAAAREARGEIVALKSDGTAFDHIHEVTDAQNGLLNSIRQTHYLMGKPGANFEALQSELSHASRLLDYSEKFVPRTAS